MIDTRLADRVALVTGADNQLGIGAALARVLAHERDRFHERYLARAAEWGRIVNISTDGSRGTDEVSYWASKHTLDAVPRWNSKR